MPETPTEAIEGFIDSIPAVDKTLLLLNRTGPEQFAELLERGLDRQEVSVAERHVPEGVDDLVCLVVDGETVATTPLSDLAEAYLLVNADRYRTGTRQLETGSFPDVLTGLDDVEFRVRGYPESSKEKLLLIVLSRFVEARALEAAGGTFRSSFQRLSRLSDELGTRTIYEWLGESPVDAHVYGVPDDTSAVEDLDLTVHTGTEATYRRSWVVSFLPPDPVTDPTTGGPQSGAAALVALETGDNVWRGTWTFDRALVEEVDALVERVF